MPREFDPEEVQYFKAVLEAEKTYLEDQVIKQLKSGGILSYAPAFGITTNAQSKLGEYTTNFNNVWSDLQSLKATLSGMIDAMETALEGHELTEEVNVESLQVLESAASAQEPATNEPQDGGDYDVDE